jgi:hypothetical protein
LEGVGNTGIQGAGSSYKGEEIEGFSGPSTQSIEYQQRRVVKLKNTVVESPQIQRNCDENRSPIPTGINNQHKLTHLHDSIHSK